MSRRVIALSMVLVLLVAVIGPVEISVAAGPQTQTATIAYAAGQPELAVVTGAAPISGAAAVTATTSSYTAPVPAGKQICKKEDIKLVNSMREIAQPYHANLDKGGKMFIKWAGLRDDQYVLQLNQGDTDKQVALARALLSAKPECTIFNVEPNADVVVRMMDELATETGAWIVTHWDGPEGYYPFDGHDHWLAHVSVPSFQGGYEIGKALCEAMGGKGNIVVLEGKLDVKVAQDRFLGLQKALQEYPNVKMVDHQSANWDRSQAFPIMQAWLTKYTDIAGVWAGNDDMALGALEALRAAGLAGKVPVVGIDGIPEAIQAIKKGEYVETVSSDASYQGSIGLAMGLAVLTGQVEAAAQWPQDHRMFYLTPAVINKSNVDQWLGEPDPKSYASTWEAAGLWSRSLGPSYPAK